MPALKNAIIYAENNTCPSLSIYSCIYDFRGSEVLYSTDIKPLGTQIICLPTLILTDTEFYSLVEVDHKY